MIMGIATLILSEQKFLILINYFTSGVWKLNQTYKEEKMERNYKIISA